ncbi:MAG TPA: hypothetical protein VJR29_02935 [bacterium]|nr:hypothetical protein [bacterium]
MSNPIKNNQTPPTSNDPYSKSYGNDPYGGDYGSGGYDPGMGDNGAVPPDSYSGYEDMNYGDYGDFSDMNGDFEVEGGDEGYGDDAGMGAGGPITEASVRAMLRDLQGTLSEDDYRAFQGRINATTGMSPERAAAELQAIAEELNMIANPQESVDGMVGEDGEPVNNEAHAKSVEEFKDELEDYRDDVMDMENLTEAEKTEYCGAIDRMINDIELAEKDPARLADIDVEGMREELNELKTGVDGSNLHSQGVKGLAELAGMTPEELAAKAEASGISLDNLSLPPPMELFDFLKEISPELKTKLEAVETAANERAKFYEDNKYAADSINSSNTRSTTDGDNSDTTAWQNLYDLKYHQDDKSKAVMDAMKAVTETLTPLLEALYPGQDVKPVEVSGYSGWELTHQQYLVADQISIGGTVIDLFSDLDGKISPSTTLTESEINIEIPSIKYDNEGDGQWKPPDLQTFGDPQVGKSNYDSDAG